jgi:tetratricopeptide (TPR) repeat protein
MQELLKHFAELRAVVLLDNFEDLVNPETRTIVDSDLAEALRVLLDAPHHRLKVVVTTRLAAFDLAQIQPGRQQRLDLDEGLPSPHAENILRALDIDGKVGLRDASDVLLNEARERTRGFPKALECLFGILSGDRGTSLLDILEDTKKLLPDQVFEVLVGEAFSRLDSAAQQVLQAIAIYGRPVPPVAADFLLQPYLPGMESTPILSRLVNMKLLHKETGRYYLHAVDTEYAIARIAPGKASDRQIAEQPPFTRFALFHRAANYFQQTRKPSADWKTLDDLSAQLAEFDLRCAGQEYEIAVQLLDTIDFDYLQLWGHLRLIIELRERLLGKLTDSSLARLNAGNLGRAYLPTGRVSEAIRCFEEALQGAREKADRRGISLWLGNLAFCCSDLGQTQKAIETCEEALVIAREIGDRKQEGSLLGFLGHCHVSMGGPRKAIPLFELGLAIARETGDSRSQGADLSGLAGCYVTLGQTVKAMEYVEQALVIERKLGNRPWLGNGLSMLGICYNDLGHSDVAVNYLQQALEIARQTGHHFGEGLRLLMLALIHVNEGRYAEALRLVLQSIEITKKIERPKLVSFCAFSLAQVYFHSGDLAAARAAAESACGSNFKENTHNAFALLGLIALRQKDQAAARTAFERAVAGADAMLTLNEFSVDAFDAKGLASCGLALCGDPGKIPAAIEAYRAARVITRAAGLVKRVLRMFDALPIPDNSAVLAEVRLAAAGE